MKFRPLDLFTIGIGPSSSHTVGPMRASFLFNQEIKQFLLKQSLKPDDTFQIKCDLYGSLALTGKGHGTDKAIILGLLGLTPENIDSDLIENYLLDQKKINSIEIHQFKIKFQLSEDLKFHRRISLPFHPNAMALALFQNNQEVLRKTYYSIGGGFIVEEHQQSFSETPLTIPFPFESGADLLKHCQNQKMNLFEIILANEMTFSPKVELEKRALLIWQTMQKCMERGFRNSGILPGGLKVKRRAPEILKQLRLREQTQNQEISQVTVSDWVNLYAIAVNEENAAGGQVVTAPTNGAAGIIPAVLNYLVKHNSQFQEKMILEFLLTAGAIGCLYKLKASLSGAEVGCQGEVGVACSMAAAALTQCLGGSPEQVENAAEIAMEHNLGLTCDPIGGLVQIPCIERNAMGAIKAINASRLALLGDGSHVVSLDKVIKTMMQTGKDMKKSYKETSQGGLAVNYPEC